MKRWIALALCLAGSAWAERPPADRADAEPTPSAPIEGDVTLDRPAAPSVAPLASLRAAVDAWRSGDRASARALAESVVAGGGVDAAEARALVQALDFGPLSSGKVGVLLPMTGKYAGIATALRAAVEDGWGQAAGTDRLVFEDTGGTAEGAVAAVRRLAVERKVAVVLGPVLSDETQAVVDAADSLGVPLVTMSQTLQDASPWPWVFQGWLTPRDQVRALLDHVMGETEARRFAVLAPATPYGEVALAQITSEVAARGGELAVSGSYPSDAKTLGAHVKPFTGGGFDALVIPGDAAAAAAAANALAFNNVALGSFRVPDTKPALLLGLSGLNRPELISTGGAGVRGGFITDVYVPPPPGTTGQTWYAPDRWRPLTERFEASVGRPPAPVEALASDTAYIVAQALRAPPGDRWAAREALLQVKPVGTLQETAGFDPTTHVLRRKVAVLEVRGDGFRPVDLP